MRMTEEEYAEFMARKTRVAATRCQPAAPSGVTLEEQPKERGRRTGDAEPGEKQGSQIARAAACVNVRRTKYGNRRTEAGGHTFDSKHEAEVYEGLMLMVRTGELKAVIRQVGFDLPGGIRYFADFVTIDQDNRITVYDAKSEATRKNRVYINKKKQMKALWDLEIMEV